MTQVHDRNDQNFIVSFLVDHTIGKSVREAATGSLGERCPGIRIVEDALQCAFDFQCKLKAESGTEPVSIIARFVQFFFSRLEEFKFYSLCFFSLSPILSKTICAGIDLIC